MTKTPEQYEAEQVEKRRKRAEYARQWRILNPEKYAAIEARKAPKDPEIHKAYMREYYAKNKDKWTVSASKRKKDPDARAKRRRWEAAQRAADPEGHARKMREWRAANI